VAVIHWSEKYSVKIRAIDDQHKTLFEMINRLSDSMKAGKSNEEAGGIFMELIHYTDQHFKEEEKLFRQYVYPNAKLHIQSHDALRAKAMELKGKHDAGSFVVTVQLLNFLVEWINKHILEEDHQYSAFLNGKGVH